MQFKLLTTLGAAWEECWENYKDRKHLRANGQSITLTGESPKKYLDRLQHLIANTKLPEYAPNMSNDSTEIAADINTSITNELLDKTVFLLPYSKEKPKNKVLWWGAVFDTLFDFLVCNLWQFKDPSSQSQVARLSDEANRLIRLIYKKTLVDSRVTDHMYGYDAKLKCQWELEITQPIYGPAPCIERKAGKQVSDEQLIAINRLKYIFETIIGLIYFTEPSYKDIRFPTLNIVSNTVALQNRQY